MSTHVTALSATVACAAAALISLPVASTAAAQGPGLLPGDVRVWELAHPAGLTSALLPGDLRLQERSRPADAAAPAAASRALVVTVDDDAVEVLQLALGALVGMAGAAAVGLVVTSRRSRTTTA